MRTLPDLTKRDEQIFIPCWRLLPPGPDCVKVIDTATNQPKADLKDLGVLVFLAPGIWQQREWAKPLGAGRYEVSFIPPQTGVYDVFFQAPSLGVKFNQLPSFHLQATKDN